MVGQRGEMDLNLGLFKVICCSCFNIHMMVHLFDIFTGIMTALVKQTINVHLPPVHNTGHRKKNIKIPLLQFSAHFSKTLTGNMAGIFANAQILGPILRAYLH